MLTITRKMEFDAGHRIPDHNSQCRIKALANQYLVNCWAEIDG